MKKPSVTELCDILNKPALLNWANKLGLQGKSIKSYSKNVLSDGTRRHKEIEDYLLHGVDIDDISLKEKIESIFGSSEIISIEESFENDHYKGRCDIRFIKDGINYVADFKRKFKKPYLEHYIQLIAYKIHFGSEKIAIIDLSEFKMIELSLYNENEVKELIYNLVNIYNLKQKMI